MPVTQYIGSRYVPIFADPIEWSSSNTYEPLTIVLHEGNSYTSKQAVPKGIDITNEAYWALTGNYDAQVELYRRETAAAKAAADDAQADATAAKHSADNAQADATAAQQSADNAQNDINNILPKSAFADTTVKDYVDASIDEITSDSYIEPSFNILFDGYETTVNCYVTALRLPRSKYAMNAYIPYATMLEALNYKEVFARYNNTVFCAPNLPSNYLINNGVATGVSYEQTWCLLCVDNENNYSIVEVYADAASIDTQKLLDDGIKNALIVWEPIVVNGIAYPSFNVPDAMTGKNNIINGIHPRFVIGWDTDYIYLISVSGSIPYSAGLNHEQLVTLITKLNIPNAINCDGGGSTQLWLCPSGINLCYTRNVSDTQQRIPGNSRAKPMTGFAPKNN